MTPRRPRPGRGKADYQAERTPAEFWRAVADPGPPAPMAPGDDPTAMVRSLGPLSLVGQPNAERHLAAVVERASGLATALALAMGALAPDDEEPGP